MAYGDDPATVRRSKVLDARPAAGEPRQGGSSRDDGGLTIPRLELRQAPADAPTSRAGDGELSPLPGQLRIAVGQCQGEQGPVKEDSISHGHVSARQRRWVSTAPCSRRPVGVRPAPSCGSRGREE